MTRSNEDQLPPNEYFAFNPGRAHAREVTAKLTDIRAQVAAGEPLSQELALALLDYALAVRQEHMGAVHERVWAPGDTYQVCVCGAQVMPLYDREKNRYTDMGLCTPLKDMDFAVRPALGLPMPTFENPVPAQEV